MSILVYGDGMVMVIHKSDTWATFERANAKNDTAGLFFADSARGTLCMSLESSILDSLVHSDAVTLQ